MCLFNLAFHAAILNKPLIDFTELFAVRSQPASDVDVTRCNKEQVGKCSSEKRGSCPDKD